MHDPIIQLIEISLQVPEMTIKVQGEPGAGKTRVVGSIVEGLGQAYWPITASTCDPTDMRGIPFPNRETGAADLMVVGRAFREILFGNDKTKIHTILWDEWSNTPPSVEAAALKVIDEGIVGDFLLPRERVNHIIVENPSALAANGHTTSPPFANRVCHVEWPKNRHLHWIAGMLQGWPKHEPKRLPSDWREKFYPAAARNVCTYMATSPQELDKCPVDDPAKQSGPWPSQRTWHYSTIADAACKAYEASDEVRQLVFHGYVGDAAATKFFTWERELDLIDAELLFNNPQLLSNVRVDQRTAQLFSLVTAFAAKPTADRWKKFGPILKFICDENKTVDIAALMVKDLFPYKPSGCQIWPEIKGMIPLLQAAGLYK